MNIKDLTKGQLNELKIKYLDELLQKEENRGISYGEMANIDDIVADDDDAEAHRDDEELLPDHVDARLAPFEQARRGREDADDGEEDQHEHDDPDHLVTFKAFREIPERAFLRRCHRITVFLRLP